MLRFTPDGRVLVCCANDQHALGVAAKNTIREMWDGEERTRIADALDALDYSLGCDECGAERALGNRARSIEAVELTARSPKVVPPDVLAGLRSDLRDWAGQEPIAIRLVDGIVQEVDAPQWAAPMDTTRWIGWPNEVLLADMVDHIGLLRDFEAEAEEAGIQKVSYWVDVDGERAPFRCYIGDSFLLGATPVALDVMIARQQGAAAAAT